MPKDEALSAKLPVEPGTPLLVDLAGVATRLNCEFAGMEQDRCLIVRLPLVGNKKLPVKDEASATVRFVSQGNVYGFRTRVIGHFQKGPLDYVFLDFPSQVETVELRQGSRISCMWPAKLQVAGGSHEGIVVDIGLGGVSFIVPLAEGQNPPGVNLGELVSLKASLLGLEGTHSIRCQVRNLNVDSNRLALGLEFASIEPQLLDQIKGYVRTVSQFMAGGI